MLGVLSAGAPSASAALTIAPLSTFGGGDGWLAPGENGYAYLGTGNNERGLAYGNNHLYLVSRSGGNNVRILDPVTGSDLGGLNVTGITGGTFAINQAATGGDGAIYVANLTTNSTTSAFKVYKWSNEAAAPTVAFSGDPLPGARLGDSLAGIGSGGGTRLAAGFGSSPVVSGNNGYAIIDPTAGAATAVGFTGTPPNGGDFRLGITFTDVSHVLGSQGNTLYRYTSYSGTSGTLLASPAFTTTAERLMAYTEIDGLPLLATQSTGDSTVRIYDATDPASPVLLASGNATSGTLTSNGNGSGELAWGPSVDGSATLYAMSTNQGIQAFTVTVPEPTVLAPAAIALAALTRTRKRRRA
jgi:hypothetical protein